VVALWFEIYYAGTEKRSNKSLIHLALPLQSEQQEQHCQQVDVKLPRKTEHPRKREHPSEHPRQRRHCLERLMIDLWLKDESLAGAKVRVP
jgi:hypothetical protein